MKKLRALILVAFALLLAAGSTSGQPKHELRRGPAAAALRLLSTLDKDSSEYSGAVQAVALSFWRHGQYESAFAQVDKVEPEKQIELLCYLASTKPQSTQPDQAVKALSRALLVLTADSDLRDSYWVNELARRAVGLDELDLAVKFADALDEGSERKAAALISIAEARAKNGESEKALVLLDEAVKQFASFDEDEKPEVFYLMPAVTRLLVALGRKERAAEVMKEAELIVVRHDLSSERNNSLLAIAYAESGDFNRSLTLIETIDDERKLDAVTSLALAYATSGNESAALASLVWARQLAVSTAEGDYNLAISLNQVARTYLRIDRPDDVFEILRTIRDDYYVRSLAIELADSFARKGRRLDAIAALDFAFAQIRQIVSEKSEDIPASASSSRAQTKSHALVALGTKYTELGDLSRAETAATAIDQPQYKASLLARIAVSQAKAGDRDKGRSLLANAFKISSKAPDYNHDAFRETVLLSIAEAYAGAGLKEEAANVVLRFLAELRDGDNTMLTIAELMELGLIAETNGIPVNRKANQVLSQVITQFKEQ